MILYNFSYNNFSLVNWNHIGFKLRNDPFEPFGVMAASQLWEGSSPHFVERIPWTSELRTTICKQMGRKEKKSNVWQCHFLGAQQGDSFKLLLNENWRFQHVWIFTLVPVSQVSFNFNIFNHGVTAAMVRRSSRSVAQPFLRFLVHLTLENIENCTQKIIGGQQTERDVGCLTPPKKWVSVSLQLPDHDTFGNGENDPNDR